MKKLFVSSLFAILLVLTVGCAPTVQVTTPSSTMQLAAPGANPLINQPDAQGRVARAVAGLWHGIIAPISLILSFFNSDVQMYEVHNAGAEYNFGFLLGIAFDFALINLLLRWRRPA